jgi:hypothetical protein
MSEPLVKQIVDLKEEHTLMLEALKAVEWASDGDCVWCWNGVREGHASDCLYQIAIKAAEEGNERRKAVGNVDLPDRRGMKADLNQK